MLGLPLTQMIFLVLILPLAIGLHEFAHAYMSHRLGDPTPKLQWRLSVNPLKHLDPVGFFLIFLIGFGRGKPVIINPRYYKNPLRDELLVALAGPAMNLLLAIAGIIVLFVYASMMGMQDAPLFLSAASNDLVMQFWLQFCFLNIALAVFNMIPVPPLDGFRLIKILVPGWARIIERYTLYISMFLLVVIVFGPGSGLLRAYIVGTSTAIFDFLYGLLSHIFF